MWNQQRFTDYDNVGSDYFDKRRLQKSVSWQLLWFLGVGAVISGDFSGWNFGLVAGGFWGLAIATALMALMYICMVYSIAELSAALPHAGGFYSFTRNAFGPLAGFICGVMTTIEYVLTPAVIVFFIGSYLNTLLPAIPVPVWWLLFYLIFVAINIRSVELTLKVGLFITLMAATVLVIFYFGALLTDAFNPSLLFNIPPDPGQSATWLPKGWAGVFKSLPYAIWFYLAIEQLPLAAEEARDVKDIPDALTWGIYTLLFFSLFTLIVNSGVAGGAVEIGKSAAPLADGFKAAFGEGIFTTTLTLIAITGLIASFHTVIYAYGRVIFALSRAGYFPRQLSVTSKSRTPATALIVGAVIGLICTTIIQIAGGQGVVGAALLNMAVLGAVVSYILVMLSYIKLKVDRPELQRPYKSPLGIWGAGIGAGLAIVAFFACFSDAAYRPGVWGVTVFFVAAVFYFWFYSRRNLVAQAPEEEEALLARVHDELPPLQPPA